MIYREVTVYTNGRTWEQIKEFVKLQSHLIKEIEFVGYYGVGDGLKYSFRVGYEHGKRELSNADVNVINKRVVDDLGIFLGGSSQ